MRHVGFFPVSPLSTYSKLHTTYSSFNPSFRLRALSPSPYYLPHTTYSQLNPSFRLPIPQSPNLQVTTMYPCHPLSPPVVPCRTTVAPLSPPVARLSLPCHPLSHDCRSPVGDCRKLSRPCVVRMLRRCNIFYLNHLGLPRI